jgi:hypothetical protein
VGALLCAPENVQAQAPTSQPQQSPYSPVAIAALQRQAHAGDANAQFRLGISYEHRIGVPRDVAQAFSWYPVEDATGRSRLLYEDFAIAMIDEVEQRKFIKKRFTVGY